MGILIRRHSQRLYELKPLLEVQPFKPFLNHSSRVNTCFSGIRTGLATPRSRKYRQAHESVYSTPYACWTILRNRILKKRNRKRNDSKSNALRCKLQPQPLPLCHLSVNLSFSHQLLMTSTLHHLSFINDKYSICTLDCTQAMSNRDRRSVLSRAVDRMLDQIFRF
jgi:hypothetical protein